MSKKVLPYRQECLAALDLLRSWQVIPEGSPIGVNAVSEVVERYAEGMWYRFGDTLFDHLARAVNQPNPWVIPGPGNPGFVLEMFLNRTCSMKNPVTMTELRAEFKEIADAIKLEYNEEIKWNHGLTPIKNIQTARRRKVELWMDKRMKAKPA